MTPRWNPTWPFDPADVGPATIRKAVEDLGEQAGDGLRQVDRAVGALEIAVSLLHARTNDFERHGPNLADIDQANREVYRFLQDAMNGIYEAVRKIEGLS